MLCSSSSRIPCPLTISSRRYSSMKERSLTISSRVGRGPSGTDRGQVSTEQQDTTSPHYHLHLLLFYMQLCVNNEQSVTQKKLRSHKIPGPQTLCNGLDPPCNHDLEALKKERWKDDCQILPLHITYHQVMLHWHAKFGCWRFRALEDIIHTHSQKAHSG